MTTIMAIKLSVLVNFVMVLSFKYGFGQEICVAENFKANCSREEFVLIERALLGGFSNSTCYHQPADQPNCFSDMKAALQERFGANDSISFSMADELIYRGLPKCHPPSSPFSLNISHRCAKVFEVECDGGHLGTVEGSNLEIRCNVRFPQRISSSPVMQWFRNGSPISPNIKEDYHPSAPTRLKTGLLKVLLRANASDDGSLFSCRVAFGSPNAEEFVYHWNFTASVWHGPNNIRIDPVKSVYDSGDRIRCHADGNPDPVFTWRSISASGDEDLSNGSVLTLGGAALFESALALECTATNPITGFSVTQTMNVTVRSGSGVPLSYRYLIVGASCGFVILVFLVAGPIAALMRCRGSCGSDDDLYIVQAINSNKQNKHQNFEHINIIYSNDSSEGEEDEEGGGGGGGREEVIYAEADETSFASCPTAPSKRRLPGDGCAVYEAPVTTTEDTDYLNYDEVDGVDVDGCYDNARSLPPHTKEHNGKEKEKEEQEYRNVAGVNEYSTLAPPPPTVTSFLRQVLARETEYVSVDHTACRKIRGSSKGGPEGP